MSIHECTMCKDGESTLYKCDVLRGARVAMKDVDLCLSCVHSAQSQGFLVKSGSNTDGAFNKLLATATLLPGTCKTCHGDGYFCPIDETEWKKCTDC